MKALIFVVLALCSAVGSQASPILPGRVISQLNFGDPLWRETIQAGERVTLYLAETYTSQAPESCLWCPALPTFVNYSAVADVAALTSGLQVELLTYYGLPSLSFGVNSYQSGILSYLDEEGNLQQIDVAQSNGQPADFPANLLTANGLFRADLTNLSSQPLELIYLFVSTGAVTPTGGFSSAAAPAPPPSAIPEPSSWLLVASIVPVALLLKRAREL